MWEILYKIETEKHHWEIIYVYYVEISVDSSRTCAKFTIAC